ncbi:Crp/Fnr family transcriptional regulator [Chelativorans sp. AA-79]|uniref:Crp/Fnr family transcriptional regulator n=1 Tax=Chelativorans sp. AA-79 TaxID=3028735 RepID=UPI0023F93D06|nr:Crp/Fnr family transcriptional regulator [Chelativorans sp. AA-79]WEX10703.1 Crp/Fnr family transcriptional regulator [Chelativorans sp. AA-79]
MMQVDAPVIVETATAARDSLVLSDHGMDFRLLDGLNAEERAAIYACGRHMQVPAGTHLFRQGESHDGVFIILSGKVRTYYVGPNGRELTLAHWLPGNFVGGPELFGRGEHIWSGVTQDDSTILAMPGLQMRALAESIPRLALNLLDAVVAKGRCYSIVLQMLGTRSVTQRLAHLLLVMGDYDFVRQSDAPIQLKQYLSQDEMATIVGATRQWVSAAIDKFRRGGMIESRPGRRIRVLRPQDLAAIAME